MVTCTIKISHQVNHILSVKMEKEIIWLSYTDIRLAKICYNGLFESNNVALWLNNCYVQIS